MSPNYTTTGNRGVRGATQSSSSTSANKTFSASATDEWTDADTAAGYYVKLVIAELAFGRFEILCGQHMSAKPHILWSHCIMQMDAKGTHSEKIPGSIFPNPKKPRAVYLFCIYLDDRIKSEQRHKEADTMKDERTDSRQLGDDQLEAVCGGMDGDIGAQDKPCRWDAKGNPTHWYDPIVEHRYHYRCCDCGALLYGIGNDCFQCSRCKLISFPSSSSRVYLDYEE